jgi:citrate synthase
MENLMTAKLTIDGKEFDLPTFRGTEDELAIDISKLRALTGAVTYDPGYGNTGACKSSITYIDGETGILRYRGYPIEDLAGKVSFPDVAYLLVNGDLPTPEQSAGWNKSLQENALVHESLLKFFDHFPVTAHPMNILSGMINAMSSFHPHDSTDDAHIDKNILRLISQVNTLAAFSYKKSIGQPLIYPRNDLSYSANFLHTMFATPCSDEAPKQVLVDALDMLLVLHADHEQNCSTSTVRMVSSSEANIYASVSAGVNALWGPLHGGANQAVLEMLEQIQADGADYKKYVELAKRKDSGFRLMGFGHRVYKNFDPRAKLLKAAADAVLEELGVTDPLLDIAKSLEQVALEDDFFISRKLYPNVDFYSGVIYRALGIPTNMFTVLFSIGRMPGWIAHWMEMRNDPDGRIHRPRQIYTGATLRNL